MLYLASALPPTAIIDSKVLSNFTSPESRSLLIAKPDRVEVWDIGSSGLIDRGSIAVWGNILSLAVVEVKGAKPHILVLLSPPTARLLLITFEKELIITSSISLTPPIPSLRRAEFFNSVISHEGTALVSLWVGVLSCVEMEVEKDKDKRRKSVSVVAEGKLVFKDNFNLNIREHNLLHLSFLPQPLPSGPLLTFLYLTPSQSLHMQTRLLSSHAFTDITRAIDVVSPNGESVDESTDFADIQHACPAARSILPIGRSVLVMGDEYSVLYSLAQIAQSPKRRMSVASGPATSPRASAKRSPQNEMVGGGQGKRRKSSTSNGEKWEMRPVWRIRQGFGNISAATVLHEDKSRASVLISDDCGRLTAFGWAHGDGILDSVQVEKVDMGLTSPASSLTPLSPTVVFAASAIGDSQLVKLSSGSANILERWMNLAPVKDFAVVEDESGAVSHLVVASGSTTSNSLRIVRSGVGLEEIIHIEGLVDVQKLWTINDKIMISTTSTTAMITMEEEVSMCQELSSTATLAAATYGDKMVTVKETGVDIWLEVVGGTKASSWTGNVGTAAISETHVVVATSDQVVVLSSIDLSVIATIPAQAASIAISPDVIAIGTWTSQIQIHSLSDFATSTTIKEEYYPKSLSFAGGKLLAGLSDGSLIVYDFNPNADTEVKSRKVSSLGTRPLDLHPINGWEGTGDEEIVGIGLTERMSVIFGTKDRIDFSSVSRKDITAATAVKIPGGQALVLATSTGLVISKVNSLKKLSVQTMDLKEKSATKLAYVEGVLAVGCVTRSMSSVTGEIFQKAALELRDSTTLRELASMPLLQREVVTTLQPVLLLGRPYLAVGTAIFPSDIEYEDAVSDNDYRVTAKEGRVLIIEPDNDMTVVTLLKTIGPVHDLKTIHGFLAIAAAGRISTNRLTPGPVGTLVELSSFASTFIAQHLSVTPRSASHPEDRLVVGDGMRSVFVLDVDEGSGNIYGDQRDMATHRVCGMEGIRDGVDGVVITDGHANLLTFRFNETIESAASFGLHEEVVRFKHGSLAPPSSASDTITPDLLFASRSGRLGMIGELTPGAAKVMDDLQRNMNRLIKGPGLNWGDWRRGGSELIKRETAGFIDGDFVQTFLDKKLTEQDKLIAGSSVHEQIHKLAKGGLAEVADKSDVIRVLEAVAGLH